MGRGVVVMIQILLVAADSREQVPVRWIMGVITSPRFTARNVGGEA